MRPFKYAQQFQRMCGAIVSVSHSTTMIYMPPAHSKGATRYCRETGLCKEWQTTIRLCLIGSVNRRETRLPQSQ